MWYEWRPHVSAAERRRRANRDLDRFRTKGLAVCPVVIQGRTIARSFWGKAWCDNLNRYSDFANRLPRGRSYLRNGSVLDLQIAPGEVTALVSGTAIYDVAVSISAVPKTRWAAICRDCAGAIDSLVELLQGRLSDAVMERICREKTGLFPAPAEIRFSCSCPDQASMCKHLAAVLYGIGARLDQQPELLFKLRKVREEDLVADAGSGVAFSSRALPGARVLDADSVSQLFGVEMAVRERDAPLGGAAARGKRGGARPGSRTRTEAADRAAAESVGEDGDPAKQRARHTARGRKVGPKDLRNRAGRQRPGNRGGARGGAQSEAAHSRVRDKVDVEALIAAATVDAYGESEERTGLYTMMEEHLALPFEITVLGVRVTVERLDLSPADEIVAVCRRGTRRQRISILDVPLPTPRPAGAEWIEAYRRWARGL